MLRPEGFSQQWEVTAHDAANVVLRDGCEFGGQRRCRSGVLSYEDVVGIHAAKVGVGDPFHRSASKRKQTQRAAATTSTEESLRPEGFSQQWVVTAHDAANVVQGDGCEFGGQRRRRSGQSRGRRRLLKKQDNTAVSARCAWAVPVRVGMLGTSWELERFL